MQISCSLKLFPIFNCIFWDIYTKQGLLRYSSKGGHRITMAHQLCMRGQYSYTLHCMLHSREGHSVPIKKAQKPKIKAITLFFFFVIASIRLRCERCPTVQEEYVSSKRKSKIVHSNLQVTEEKNKKERKEPWMWCFCVQKRKRWPSC